VEGKGNEEVEEEQCTYGCQCHLMADSGSSDMWWSIGQ
jgi:hypothetical protein